MVPDGSRIGDLFPADDLLARWVLVLCLARNDVVATMKQIVRANEDDDGTNLHWARVTAGHLYEIATFLRQSSSLDEVKDFAKRLPPKADADRRALLDATFLKRALVTDRSLTFHYPSVDADDPPHGGAQLKSALEAAENQPAELLVELNGGKPTGYRYRFADVVAAEFATASFGETEDDRRAGVERARDLALAYARFADAAFYLWGKDAGVDLGEYEPYGGTTHSRLAKLFRRR